LTGAVRGHEWDYWPEPEGEPFTDKDGNEVIGWHDRAEDQDPAALCAAFEAYEGRPLLLRPIFVRTASEVECRVHGWEEGTFVRCRRPERAKNPWPMWQIEVAPNA
jgi:hypothetical protein